jgi:hypothetical protein
MAVTEKHRHELFNEVERVLGPQHAETLMELLPPVGWADVATKHDLDSLRVATKHDLAIEIGAVRGDLGTMSAVVATSDDLLQLRRDLTGWLITAMGIQTGVIGLLFTFATR